MDTMHTRDECNNIIIRSNWVIIMFEYFQYKLLGTETENMR